MSKKDHKIFKKCPYCGETLYEDEMCRCRFDDEIEIIPEGRGKIGSSPKPVPTVSAPKAPVTVAGVAERFCKKCGATLIAGRPCSCAVVAHTRSPAETHPKSHDTGSGIKINMRSHSSSVVHRDNPGMSPSPHAPISSPSSVSSPAPASGGSIKSTMRQDNAFGEPASKKIFNPTGRDFLSKPDDF